MTVSDLKSDLHRMVVETDDVEILAAVQNVFAVMQKQKKDWWDLLSEEQKQTVGLSLQQADKGDLIPASQVRNRINSWIQAKS